MDKQGVLEIIGITESPLRRQVLIVALVTRLLEEKAKTAPIMIGGRALSYCSREGYSTAIGTQGLAIMHLSLHWRLKRLIRHHQGVY